MIQELDSFDFFSYKNNFESSNHIMSNCIFSNRVGFCNVTISIPTYKRACTLNETIESALSQKCNFNYQIFVFDNNPERNDETELLMSRFNGGNVSYFKNQENLGMGGNWNRCISMPQTDWVVLLHDDDTIEPDFLQKCFDALKEHDCSILQTLKYSNKGKRPFVSKVSLYQYSKLDLYHSFRIQAPSGTVFKREDFLKSGGFNPQLYPSLDYCYFVKILETQKVYLLKDYLTYYRLEVNASFKKDTHLGWITIDHFLIRNLLKKYGFPQWIVEPFLQSKLLFDARGISNLYGYEFQVPKSLLSSKKYSSFAQFCSLWIVRAFVIYERIKTKLHI